MSKLFIFVDESGDPGNTTSKSSSVYYQLNLVVATHDGVFLIQNTLSRLKYFLNFKKELKEYWYQGKLRTKITDATHVLLANEVDNIKAFTFFIDKRSYTGPYLCENSKKFRNFILSKSLEGVFAAVNPDVYTSFELVLDRYLESRQDQENLRKYLHNNYVLPRSADNKTKIHHIVHVQSVYSEAIQFADIIGRYCSDNNNDLDLVVYKDLTYMKKGSVTHASA